MHAASLLRAESPRQTGLVQRILILDNAAIHSSNRTKKALEKFVGRIVLHFLPPYCPQSNRIERVWWDVHANVTRNHR